MPPYVLKNTIKQINDPILRQVSKKVDVKKTDEILKIFKQMKDALKICHEKYEFTWSSGISAVQIGILNRLCLVWTPAIEWIVMVNPKIISQSDNTNLAWEGCLSFFDKRGLVARPDWIEIEFYTPQGEKHRKRYEGNEARIICHEIDHMDGILYIDRIENADCIIDIEEYKELKKSGELPTKWWSKENEFYTA